MIQLKEFEKRLNYITGYIIIRHSIIQTMHFTVNLYMFFHYLKTLSINS